MYPTIQTLSKSLHLSHPSPPLWHNLTNDRHFSSESLFSYKDKVIDAIYKEGAFSQYYKINRKWQTLYQVLMGEKIGKKLTKEKLEELYYGQNKSLDDIGKEYGCSKVYVSQIMKKYGLIRRTQSTARMEAIKKGKFIRFTYDDSNENFFSVWSPGMAWALGLLYTDGNVSPGTVSLSSVDLELLEKVKKLLNSPKPIHKVTQSYDKSKYIYRFSITREKLVEDLYKFGLHQKKSLNIAFPDIPQEYMRHFIRGCWDGDGSIYFDKNRLGASYISGSKDFIIRLVAELYKIGIFKKGLSYRIEKGGKKVFLPVELPLTEETISIYSDGRFPLRIHMKNMNAYYIKIVAKENIEKLFHYFYDGIDESMFLSRKYNVFVKGLKLQKSETKQLSLDLDF